MAGFIRICFVISLSMLLTNNGADVPHRIPKNVQALLLSSFQDSFQKVESVLLNAVKRQGSTQSPMQMFSSQRRADPEAQEISKAAEVFEMTLLLLKNGASRRHKRAISVSEFLSVEHVELIANWSGCPSPIQPAACPRGGQSGKYRSITGLCNNRNNPLWGAANSALARWLPAEYEDGESQPKGWNKGGRNRGFQLPLVREISKKFMQSSESPILKDEAYSQMLVDWGQYIDHDISFTPQSTSRAAFWSGQDCLSICENVNPCYPIEIPPQESLLKNKSCLPFFRSSPVCFSAKPGTPRDDLQQMFQRQQMNSVTSFLDASTVYGHSMALQRNLRNLSSSQGLLAVNQRFVDAGKRAYLPFAGNNPSACLQEHRSVEGNDRVECFIAGDSRVNEVVPLTALHTLWVREHNRVAVALNRLNPHWSAETTYQETRKVVGALHQIVTMRDYIPKVIGKQAFRQYLGPYEGYNESADPSVANVFATAAFRFGHATIPAMLQRLNNTFQEHELFPSLELHQTFFSPWRIVKQGGIDVVLRGLLARPAMKVTQDHLMNQELTERLMVLTVQGTLDLAAINLQRGRDHALPGYNEWRSFCGLGVVQNVGELGEVVGDAHLAAAIMEMYGHAGNIDVWLGGLVEKALPDARTGPLFACLIGKQMKMLREGDRFWWENPGVFTHKQREELAKHSLSRVICDNTGLERVTLDAFQLGVYPQDFVPCNSVPTLSLETWREDQS